jgi:hypothetical protein
VKLKLANLLEKKSNDDSHLTLFNCLKVRQKKKNLSKPLTAKGAAIVSYLKQKSKPVQLVTCEVMFFSTVYKILF